MHGSFDLPYLVLKAKARKGERGFSLTCKQKVQEFSFYFWKESEIGRKRGNRLKKKERDRKRNKEIERTSRELVKESEKIIANVVEMSE